MQQPSNSIRFLHGIGRGVGVVFINTGLWTFSLYVWTILSLQWKGHPVTWGDFSVEYMKIALELLIINTPSIFIGGIALAIWGGNKKNEKGYLNPIGLGLLMALCSQVPFMVLQMYLMNMNGFDQQSLVVNMIPIFVSITLQILLWWGAKTSYYKWFIERCRA